MPGHVEVKIVGERVVKAVADAGGLCRRDELLDDVEVGRDVEAIGVAVWQRGLGLPAKEPAAVPDRGAADGGEA